MADETHLKRPNVIKLIGKRRILIIGLTNNEAIAKPTPAKRRVSVPLLKTMPMAVCDTV